MARTTASSWVFGRNAQGEFTVRRTENIIKVNKGLTNYLHINLLTGVVYMGVYRTGVLARRNFNEEERNLFNRFFHLCGANRYSVGFSGSALILRDRIKVWSTEMHLTGTKLQLPVKCVMKILAEYVTGLDGVDLEHWLETNESERASGQSSAPRIEVREEIPF